MTYNPMIPQPSDKMSVSQGQLLINFAQLDSIFGVDHVQYDSSMVSLRGMHNKVTFQNVLSGAPPNFAAPISCLYTSGSPPQLFFQNGNMPANAVQLTGSVVNDGSNGTVASEYTVATPFGLIIKFGITQQVASGTTINLVTAFPTNFLGVVTTTRLAGTSSSMSGANITSSTPTSSFTVSQNTGSNQNAYFFAWGN